MRVLNPTTWVILKLRCTTTLALLVLPSSYHEHQRRGHLLTTGHVQLFVSPALEPAARVEWPSVATTALSASSRNDGYEQEEATRLGRLKRRARRLKEKARTWGPVQTFLKGGKSIVGLFRVDEKTEMEASYSSQPPALVIPKENENELEEDTFTSTTISTDEEYDFVLPKGPRWAIAHPDTDLSGTWKPIITSEFQDEYNRYLANCGTNYLFRQACLKFCSTTRETIDQVDDGRTLHFHAKSPAGGWKRSLISSGADAFTDEYEAHQSEFFDPDKEWVKVEAWWQEDGRVHKSILREKPGVCGGEFETLRYLDGNELVTESTFLPHPEHLNNPSSKFKPAFVRWKYRRED